MRRWLPLIVGMTVLLIVVVTSNLAFAGPDDAPAPCVRLAGESYNAFVVTLQPGCDLREAARLFPQFDPTTRRPLPMHEQLRSIHAFNEARRIEGNLKSRTVSRGCVPAGSAPSWASPEELEICPRGVVNYFGVASLGNIALIFLPKTRTATHAERLEELARSSCGALAAMGKSKSDSALPQSAKEALSGCRQVMGDAAIDAASAVAPSEEPMAGRVRELTVELQEKQKRIDLLENASALRWQGRPSEDRGTYALFVLSGIGLVGGTFGWLRLRRAAKNKTANAAGIPLPHAGQVVVDKETLARAMGDIERAFRLKMDKECARYEQQLESHRAMIGELERQVRERCEAQQPEPVPPSARKRAPREREKQLQAELSQLQETHMLGLQACEERITRMLQDQREADRKVANLKADLLKREKKVVSLSARLTCARARLSSGALPTSRRRPAGIGGLPAPIAEGRSAVAIGS